MYSTRLLYNLFLLGGIFAIIIGLILKITSKVSNANFYEYRRFETHNNVYGFIDGNGTLVLGFLLLISSYITYRIYKKELVIRKISKIEEEKGVIFPKSYKDFFLVCENSIPKVFIGSDLYNRNPEISDWAIELIQESNVENFLKETDFVFLMHQGYMFWYFNANGKENPDVYYYYEGDTFSKKICDLKQFIENYPKTEK